MPSIRVNNSPAGTSNAVDGLQFQDVPPGGALVTLYASTAAAGGLVSYSVGTERFLVSCPVNIESSADVVDTRRDMVLDREPVPGGKQFVAVDTQICNFLLTIEAVG